MSLNEEKPVAPLRAAATVMVARPAKDSAFEIFMVRRSAKSVFVPDVFVFPGGSLEPGDTSPAMIGRVYGLSPAEAAASFRDTANLGAFESVMNLSDVEFLGLYVAGLRELFEEAGVLFAVTPDGQPFDIGTNEERSQHFAAYRHQLHNREIQFAQIFENENLLADVSRLTYFSHWITPRSEVRRFDTRFFLAIATDDQEAEADNIETTEGVWVSPQEAFNRYKEGKFGMIYPTLAHLKRLSMQADLAALQNYARTKEVIAVSPDVRQTEGGKLDFKLSPEIAERW